MKEKNNRLICCRTSLLICSLILAVLTINGCSQTTSDGFIVSGEATYDGKPIPVGELIFTPDTGQGNKGPQGRAKIVNGKFSTADTGRNVAGGPYKVEIRGFDGVSYEGREMVVEEGRPLFGSLKGKIDLPQQSTVLHAQAKTEGKNPELVLSLSP